MVLTNSTKILSFVQVVGFLFKAEISTNHFKHSSEKYTTDINFKSCILVTYFWGLAEKVYHHGFHLTIHTPLMLSLNTKYTSKPLNNTCIITPFACS